MLIRRGDIFYADLRPVVGSEQGGVRPVLIIQNDVGNRHSPTVICAAITSQMNKAKLPTHVELDCTKSVSYTHLDVYKRQHAGVPSELIEWHGHNDFYKAVNNSTTAWLYGASGVNCSLFGIGERTGNTPLEAMVFEYAQLKGTLDGMDTTVITELAEHFEKELGYVQPSRTPFVGSNFNVTRAGIQMCIRDRNNTVRN